MDSVPMYSGPFPISLFGEYLNNPAAQSKNDGWAVGIVFGKSGKKGLWDISYQYRFLAADALYEEFTESDFGANYVAAPIGGSRGYGNGTNVRGHIVRGQFSPYDHLTIAVTYFLTELIDETPDLSDSGTGRLQVDATLKF
ncbi:MAG TPA: putative porin [Verrucomicrobiota bacterium]|nr:putative porin [Verrucomicrobiota bacterium]